MNLLTKQLPLSLLITSLSLTSFAQGTITFVNIGYGGSNAPDFLSDGTTKLAGPQFMAELMAGPTASSLASVATAPFLSGAAAGYFFGGELTINTVPCGGTVLVQINVWNTADGATFAAARASGLINAWAQSPVFPVAGLGGYCCDPPCAPAPLTGLPSLSLNGSTQPPPLNLILTSTNTLLFSWPAGGSFILQQSRNMNATNWTALTNPPVTVGAESQITIFRPLENTFYRLVAPVGQAALLRNDRFGFDNAGSETRPCISTPCPNFPHLR